MLRPSTVLRRASRQVSCNLDGEVAVLNLDKAVYFGLKGVGACIWQALEQPCSVSDVCRTIVDEYDVPAERCQADVVQFLEQLQEMGLVEPVEVRALEV